MLAASQNTLDITSSQRLLAQMYPDAVSVCTQTPPSQASMKARHTLMAWSVILHCISGPNLHTPLLLQHTKVIDVLGDAIDVFINAVRRQYNSVLAYYAEYAMLGA